MNEACTTCGAGGCQLMAGGAGGVEPLPWALRRRLTPIARSARRTVKRLYWDFRRLLKSVVQRLWPSCPVLRKSGPDRREASPGPAAPAAADIGPGDRVRVRSRAEIEATLDETGRCRGCGFLEPMAAFCGREFRVVRRIERFFDEKTWRMLRCRNIVILDGVFCDGSGHPDTRGCDRMCYFFWRTEWLERLD